jgi:hypothetical protein
LNVNTAVPEQRGGAVLVSMAPDAALREAGTSALPARRRAVVWWLWPHVLSLDAPMVAVVWQHWWARAAGVKLFWSQDAILALGVWMIYLADRLADTRQPGAAAGPPDTARHAFSARHRRVLQPLLAGVVIALAVLTPVTLPARQFAAGLGLLLVAGAYFWLIHRRRPGRWAEWVPKEAFVGLIFAVGSGFFVTWQAGAPRWSVPVSTTLFAVLCFFNCGLITQWEATAQDRGEPSSLLNAFPWLDGRLGLGCLGLAALAGLLAVGGGSVTLLPIVFGALALAWLDHQRAALSPDALRVLADLALLAPLLCGGW